MSEIRRLTQAVASMDLCAAALYRISGGPPLKGGKEADVGFWTRDRQRQFPLEADLASWLRDVTTSAEWKLLEGVRHGMTHRHFARTVKMTVGSDRTPTDEIHLDGASYQIAVLVNRFGKWGESKFLEFCQTTVTVLGR